MGDAACRRLGRREGAQAAVELGAGQAAFAIEAAEEVGGAGLPFSGVAFDAGGNQIAVGVGTQAGLGDDVIEALHGGVDLPQAVEAKAALAPVARFESGAEFRRGGTPRRRGALCCPHVSARRRGPRGGGPTDARHLRRCARRGRAKPWKRAGAACLPGRCDEQECE
jgi:hypothetical protein